MLPTLKLILEPSTSYYSMSKFVLLSKSYYPSCKIVRDISISNIQEKKKV